MNIITVCLGNICRSPMAEGILRFKLKERGIHAMVDSAGIGGWHAGENPDKRAIQTMRNHGIDISNLIARQFVKNDFDQFDIILAMDESNLEDILSLTSNTDHRGKVKLMLSYLPHKKIKSVPDPWYGNLDGFENVYQMLNESCDNFINYHFK